MLLLASAPSPAATAYPTTTGNNAAAGDACATSGASQLNGGQVLICNGATWVLGSQFLTDGKLGVGTASPAARLHVNGEAIVSSTGLACAAGTAGGIRYNSGALEFCNGTAWTSLPVADTSDQTPNAFTFTALTDQSLNTMVQSNTPTITGFTGSVVASVSGGGNPEISINGGAWVTSGAISSGQTVQVRLTTSGSVNTLRTATVTIGTGSADWQVTTRVGSLKIFATSIAYNGGGVGSLSNADALCQSQANTLGYAGSYKAILSDSSTNAKDRLTLTYPIVRASDGTTVVASANLWQGTLDNAISTTAGTYAWTGSSSAGLKTASLCSDWTDSTAGVSASVGLLNNTANSWALVATQACNVTNRLYCVQQ